MWASMDTDAIGVTVKLATDATTQRRIRIDYGELTLRLDLAEAVDLADAIVGALAEVDAAAERDIRRDEEAVRQAAEIRERLNG